MGWKPAIPCLASERVVLSKMPFGPTKSEIKESYPCIDFPVTRSHFSVKKPVSGFVTVENLRLSDFIYILFIFCRSSIII